MRGDRAAISDPLDAVLAEVRRRLAAGREGNFVAELGGGELGFALWWGRISASTPPGDPPDERYLVDEVVPTGMDSSGAIEWAVPAGGRSDVVAWNVAEALDRTHLLAAGTVVLIREELDRTSPAEFRAIFHRAAGGGGGSRMCRVEGYDDQAASYTVQPVVWDGSVWADDGDAIGGVVNVGEIQSGEEGYLGGPSGSDVYVRLYDESGAKFLAVHPPRMP